MFKAKSRRPVFLSAAILTILLGTAFVGSTFASGVNYNTQKQDPLARHYNVAFEYLNGSLYVPMQSSAALTDDMLWCPGKTEIVYLKLTNNELFPVGCSLKLNVTTNDFDDMFTYAVIEEDLKSASDHPGNWTGFCRAASKTGTLRVGEHNLRNGDPEKHEDTILLPKGSSHCMAVAIHMSEQATSAYSSSKNDEKTMNFEFVLQVNANFEPGETPKPENLR